MEKLYLIVLLAISLPTFVLGQEIRVGYGETCGDGPPVRRCFSDDIWDPLICSDGANPRCTCPENMFRHRTENRCVGPSGARCTVRAGDGLPKEACTLFAQCWPWTNNTDTGRQHGTCRCNGDAVHDTVSGECKLNYGSPNCKLETDCNVLNNIVCHENQCVCQDEENQGFDGVDKCLSLLGGQCTNNNECLSGNHLICDTANNANQCICEEGFTETANRTCAKMLGAPCDPQANDCHEDFVCVGDQASATCQCPADQADEGGSCKILAGKQCTNSNTSRSCIEHATCENEVCTCSSGYTNGTDDKCFGLLDTPCNNATVPQRCSEGHFLVCSSNNADNGTCTCMDNYAPEGDDENKRCVGGLEADCSEKDDCSGDFICTEEQKCNCPARYVNQNATCLGTHGVECGSGCSAAHLLSCNSGTNLCDCSDIGNMLHEGSSERCVWKANLPCSDNVECVFNSTCTTGNPRTCACNANNAANDQGACVFNGNNGGSTVVASSILVVIAMIVIGKDH